MSKTTVRPVAGPVRTSGRSRTSSAACVEAIASAVSETDDDEIMIDERKSTTVNDLTAAAAADEDDESMLTESENDSPILTPTAAALAAAAEGRKKKRKPSSSSSSVSPSKRGTAGTSASAGGGGGRKKRKTSETSSINASALLDEAAASVGGSPFEALPQVVNQTKITTPAMIGTSNPTPLPSTLPTTIPLISPTLPMNAATLPLPMPSMAAMQQYMQQAAMGVMPNMTLPGMFPMNMFQPSTFGATFSIPTNMSSTAAAASTTPVPSTYQAAPAVRYRAPAATVNPISIDKYQSSTTTTHLTPNQQSQLLQESTDKKSKQGDPATGKQYNRKDKSLGLLCENFLNLYGSVCVKEISLDHAAKSLGVERRRIYDIVNILESVDIVSRSGKNQYMWHGTTRLGKAIKILENAILATGKGFQQTDLIGMHHPTNIPVQMAPPSKQILFHVAGSGGDDDEDGEGPKRSKFSKKPTGRQEQSLGHLSQVFVQMFLSNDTRIVSLEDAGRWLLGGPVAKPGETEEKAQANFKSRVRRLYDIANVFTSLELIEKIHLVQTRKPAFKWLGARVYPLMSSVPREAYTSDAPTRRPTNRPGFDATFPIVNLFHAAPTPPSVPRRATIDTAELPGVHAAAHAANEAASMANAATAASLSVTTPLPTKAKLIPPIPDSLNSLQTSFQAFDAIQAERNKRTQFDVETIIKKEPGTTNAAATTTTKSSSPANASTAAPTRSGSFARPLAASRTPSALTKQHSHLLNLAASNAPLPTKFDPLLLAYARPPPTAIYRALDQDATTTATTDELTERAGFDFPLSSSSYIRDSSSFLRSYRSACQNWKEVIMPEMKTRYLKLQFENNTIAPQTNL